MPMMTISDAPKKMELTSYFRKLRVKPKYSQEVHQWLMSLGSPELLDWLSKAALPNTQLPVLLLHGAGATGKSLLSRGVSNMWSPLDLYFEENYMWGHQFIPTPFCSVNEASGNPKTVRILTSLAREAEYVCHRKYKAPEIIPGYMRVVVASDNDLFGPLGWLVVSLPQGSAARLAKMSAAKKTRWAEKTIAQHVLWMSQNDYKSIS